MKTIIDITVLIVVRSLVGFMRMLPDHLASRVAEQCLAVGLLLLPRARGVALKNLELVFPELPLSEREEIYKRSKKVLARNFMWFAKIPTLKRETLEAQFDYRWVRELFESVRLRAEDKGILLLTMHFGCFELFSNTHALLYRPVTVLARDFSLPRFNRWWWSRRELCGNTIFSRKGGFREITRCLQEGRDVAVLFDQNVKANHATFIDLFGIKAATSKPVALAVARTGAPVIFGVGVELEPGRYQFYAKEIPPPSSFPGDADTQIDLFLRAVHEEVEAVIRRHPEQWMWLHRRFKTRPAGEPESIYS